MTYFYKLCKQTNVLTSNVNHVISTYNYRFVHFLLGFFVAYSGTKRFCMAYLIKMETIYQPMEGWGGDDGNLKNWFLP